MAEKSAEPDATEDEKNRNEFASKMDVTLEADNLDLLTEELNAEMGHETDANRIEGTEQPQVLFEAVISEKRKCSKCNAMKLMQMESQAPEMEVSVNAENLELSTEESNAEAAHETDANGNDVSIEMFHQKESIQMCPQKCQLLKKKTTKLMLIELKLLSSQRFYWRQIFLQQPNPAEERPESNDENLNELPSEMEVSLAAENLELSTQESDAQARHETEANGNEVDIEMNVSPEGEYSSVSPEMSNCTGRRS